MASKISVQIISLTSHEEVSGMGHGYHELYRCENGVFDGIFYNSEIPVILFVTNRGSPILVNSIPHNVSAVIVKFGDTINVHSDSPDGDNVYGYVIDVDRRNDSVIRTNVLLVSEDEFIER